MTYYQTTTSPLVFTTQKAERVEEWMIPAMLELLLKREYETYEPEEAASNIQYWLQMDQVFSGVIAPPTKELTPKASQLWIQDLLESEAGQRLLNQVGQPLSEQILDEESERLLTDETVLSDLMEGWTYTSEGDHGQVSRLDD
jgi:hypothetical protein